MPERGGDERDRTDDPLLAKQVLSQLSYTPIFHTGSVLHLLFEVLFEPQKLNNDFFQEILHGVTGGVYKARERIHRGMLIRDY